MEFEEAHNNLRAIRLLYRLLHDNNNFLLHNGFSEHLIERARGLLKSLLDVAVVSVFQTHLKIIAAAADISNKSSFDQEKGIAWQQFESPVAANNPQSFVKDPALSEMASSQKDEQTQLKLISENGGTNNLGEENRMAKHNLVKAKDLSYENGISSNKDGESDEVKFMPMLSKIDEIQYNSSAASQVESPDKKGDFADDLLNSMKRIESRMFALQLCSNWEDSIKIKADNQTKNEDATSDGANMQRKDEIAVSQNHTIAVSAKSQKDTPNQDRTQGLNEVKYFNRLVSCNTCLGTQASDHVQDLKVIPLNQDDLTRKPSKLGDHRNRKSLVRKKPVVVWSETGHNLKKMSHENSNTQKKPLRYTGSNIARRKNPQSHQMVIRPTLLDQKSSEIKVFSHHRREGSVHVEPWETRVQPQNEEQEESTSNPQSSSSWTSQHESDNSNYNSEDYSLPSETQKNSTSGTMDDAASYEGSSEESNNSYTSNDNDNDNDNDDDDDSSSRRFGSMKSDRYYPKRNPERKIGGLKRLKNKLGLIFHHHHHHHHHHYDNDDDDDDSSIQSKRGHNKHSMWNNLQHVFHQNNKHKLLTNGKVDKTRRGKGGAVVPRGNQVGQFHRLVEGLLRHMKHSKKQKSHKVGEVKGSKNIQKHGRNGNKKLNWWKMLQQQRGVKMKNRGRVKVGFNSLAKNHQRD